MTRREISKLREKRNAELLELMKLGFSCNFVKPEDTYFPPRPMIKKDPQAIKKLYKENVKILGETEPRIRVREENFIARLFIEN